MNTNVLMPRLLWFADRVRKNVEFADIGTDHAKLPVYLVQKGIVHHAIASDIGEGPIEHARTHIALSGLSGKIDTYVGDGISHLGLTPPIDIAICGMGGETIVNIIKEESCLKNPEVRLLLQPMTDFVMLRNHLASNGFFAIEEDVVESDGRMYQCMIYSYNGEKYELSDAEAELGLKTIEKRSDIFLKYVQHRHDIMSKRLSQKSLSNIDTTEELSLIEKYNEILNG